MKEIKVMIQPIGNINLEETNYLIENLPLHFPFPIKLYPHLWSLQPPFNAYDINRMQYDADQINKYVYSKYKEFLKVPEFYILGIASFDAYYNNLNFVFGLANTEIKVASVYTKRLKSNESSKYNERLLKESIHELGHLFGLDHCSSYRCVMNFSNELADVDNKSADFCEKCKSSLVSFYKKFNA
ncbi:MAG: archaemetzincin family Zn-dependent metalloprotease [Caldisphaera sp.]|jgi:archaemetzincin|uniref:archaemetzincin family Zn-dependent metalloprotease n=1 Tax=Caldisphaera sp. TaxID=2060322 RepID=UPI00397C75D4